MNTNLKNAFTSLAKFVADKAGLIALSDFNKEVCHDLWVEKLAALAALDSRDPRLNLSLEEIETARKAIETHVGDHVRLPVRYWTMLVLQQAYACKGLSIEKAVPVLFVAKTTRPWASPEALQNLIQVSDLDDICALGVKECRKFQTQIARSQAVRESGLAAISKGGDEFDLLRGIVKAWKGANTKQAIAPVVPVNDTNNAIAKVVGLK